MVNFEELKELNNRVGELYDEGIIDVSPGHFQLRFKLFKSLFLENNYNNFSVSIQGDFLRIAIVKNDIEYITLLDMKVDVNV